MVALAPVVAHADQEPLVIEPDLLLTVDVPESETPHGLVLQATSWVEPAYGYLLSLSNLSPWPMTSLRVVDRYFSDDPDQDETHRVWYPQKLDPGQAACLLISFPEGSLAGGCHQLEISLAHGVDTILMDCSAPGSTTIWHIPLSDEMEAYLSQPPLTAAEASGRSRLGIHVTGNKSPNIMDFVREAQPAVMVAVGDLGWLAELKKASPETIILARFIEGDQTIEGDPTARAREFVSANAERYLENPSVDYWMGWNEPVIHSVEQIDWFAAYEIERTIAMAELGLKVAVGNFPVGTPGPGEFEAFLPALAVAKEHGGILALHEYSAPTMQDGVGADIPGLEASPERGALTLRYRYWYDYYLGANDLVLPLVITEAGIDGGVLRSPDIDVSGWQGFVTQDEYLAQLSWYDYELGRDSYVLGFAVFNAGDMNGRWASFDATEILPQLAELAKSRE